MTTPNGLRELLIPNTTITSDEVRRRITAAADAWQLAEDALAFLMTTSSGQLYKRLEAAVALGKAQCYKHANGDDACMCEQWDALVGEEKP